MLVLDTETTTDPSQRLLFGSYRVLRARTGKLIEEGLFYAHDLPSGDLATLERYVAEHADDDGGQLRLLSRAEFVEEVLWRVGHQARARIVGFNLPFDLSRLAVHVAPARGMGGGFSLRLWEWRDPAGRRLLDRWRPTIRVKTIDARRQLISFGTPGSLDPEHRVGRGYRGRFLDLRALAYALTDRGHSLASAARAFGVERGKDRVERHGVVSEAYIDYNRQDVRLTFELHQALMAEWARHPVELDPERAFSPAAVGKAYLRAMGVRPPMDRPNHVPDEVLGRSMAAYYGGRAECRVRRVPLPVRYVDFTSMYPSVFGLEGLWRWVVCDHFEVEDATGDARAYLASATREGLHDPAAWPPLAGVVCRVRPAGELLPVRARYGADPDGGAGNPAWTIGLNRLHAPVELWYTLADLVAAKLLGGRAPVVLEAVRVVPVGTAERLRPVRLRGAVRVDPRRDDLFRRVIEERQRIKRDPSIPAHERDRLEHFLKVFANAASYGVFAEVRQLDRPGEVTGFGLWPFTARLAAPEEPGEFSFPPLAATVTGGGRLLLALLEADVEAAGGSYVACDTDSLLIVASPTGGPIAMPHGTRRATRRHARGKGGTRPQPHDHNDHGGPCIAPMHVGMPVVPTMRMDHARSEEIDHAWTVARTIRVRP